MTVYVVFSRNSGVEGVFEAMGDAEKAIELYYRESGGLFIIYKRVVGEVFKGRLLK